MNARRLKGGGRAEALPHKQQSRNKGLQFSSGIFLAG
jgi:hypothetical protein